MGGTIDLFTTMNKESIANLKKTNRIEESTSLSIQKLKVSKGSDFEQQVASISSTKKEKQNKQGFPRIENILTEISEEVPRGALGKNARRKNDHSHDHSNEDHPSSILGSTMNPQEKLIRLKEISKENEK